MKEALQCKITNKEAKKHNHGELRVWWIPQVPMKSFNVPVKTLAEAKLVLDTLAQYDLFQYEENIKPDFSNAGGLSVFDSKDKTDSDFGSWVDWYDENGMSIDDFEIEELRKTIFIWEGA